MKKFIFMMIAIVFSFYLVKQHYQTVSTDTLSALHLNWLDKSVDPKKDFFAYANGGWQKTHPIPADYARWSTFHVLDDENTQRIKSLIETAAINNKPGSIRQKVSDFYLSGMDEATINQLGATPLQAEFKRIDAIHDAASLQSSIAHLQMIGVNAVFSFGQMQDFRDSQQVIGVVAQAGLGLPDRDYYLKNENKFRETRQLYLQHITNMLVLLGDNKNLAAAEAKTVLRLETQLAQASLSRVDQRNPNAVYHPMTLMQLNRVTPHFSWQTYFTNMGRADIKSVNMAMPGFFAAVDKQLESVALQDWKTYLRWQVISTFAPVLSNDFVQESFRMNSVLTGVKAILPRWKRVAAAEDAYLGFAIGQLYVEKYFSPKAKKVVAHMVKNLHFSMQERLETLAWMTPETRKAALEKLLAMDARVGYPDKWRDYSALTIDKSVFVLNIIRANTFQLQRELNKIGKPFDASEWDMTPQTVNAYYDPATNRLNIPAGILQPPFFSLKASAAVNYGSIGAVIGHEMVHGFDDQGAQFDAKGNLNNWWSKQDLQKFQTATNCVANQFSQYRVAGNTPIQGELVVGEATADLGGLSLAYQAFHNTKAFKAEKTIAGMTPDQQFFLSAAHVWAMNTRPQEARRLTLTDPHPPAKYRVNGTLANMAPFQLVYGGSEVSHKNSCIIW